MYTFLSHLTYNLFLLLSNLLGIRLIVLIAFCTQGDNIQDAIVMAGHIDKWIGISKKQVYYIILVVT